MVPRFTPARRASSPILSSFFSLSMGRFWRVPPWTSGGKGADIGLPPRPGRGVGDEAMEDELGGDLHEVEPEGLPRVKLLVAAGDEGKDPPHSRQVHQADHLGRGEADGALLGGEGVRSEE